MTTTRVFRANPPDPELIRKLEEIGALEARPFHDDNHYAELDPQPFDVVSGWARTAGWPLEYVHMIGEAIYALARAWRKGNPVRDLRKVGRLCLWIADRLERG